MLGRAKGELITIGENGVNWNAIRAEYIGGGISYRILADKYGVSKDAIARKAKAGNWEKLRATARDKSATMSIQKAANIAADNATIAANIKRKGLLILERLFDAYDIDGTEHRETDSGKTDIKRIRDLTAAFKDLAGDITPDTASDSVLLRSLMEMERRHD